jgi:hypothetical protein
MAVFPNERVSPPALSLPAVLTWTRWTTCSGTPRCAMSTSAATSSACSRSPRCELLREPGQGGTARVATRPCAGRLCVCPPSPKGARGAPHARDSCSSRFPGDGWRLLTRTQRAPQPTLTELKRRVFPDLQVIDNQIAYKWSEYSNIWDLFHARESMHRKVYTHRQVTGRDGCVQRRRRLGGFARVIYLTRDQSIFPTARNYLTVIRLHSCAMWPLVT